MTELLLHMNNYSITGAITTYQTYPRSLFPGFSIHVTTYSSIGTKPPSLPKSESSHGLDHPIKDVKHTNTLGSPQARDLLPCEMMVTYI